jgi:uncharacterized protein (TIGR03083 family)
MSTPPRIGTLDLFDEVNGHLLDLLRSLDAEDWHRPTVCSARDVKDLAAHLLDSALRRLSLHRDGYASPHLRPGPDGLLPFLNRLNAEWTTASRRLSPEVLIHLVDWAGRECVAFFRTLGPDGPAAFPVAWSGEQESRNWFDVAREYTERWHHSQQIFEAVGRPSPLMSRRLYSPVLETFLRALPFTFREADRPAGTSVRVVVQGDAGGEWCLVRQEGVWGQVGSAGVSPTATVTLPQEVAWKAWTKRRPVEVKLRTWHGIEIEGDAELGRLVVGMVSVMA